MAQITRFSLDYRLRGNDEKKEKTLMVDENSTDKQRWYDDLSIIRWIFAIFGILIMLFTGGCSLFILSDVGNSGGGIVALIGGIPFLIGLIIWWLAAKVGRN